MVQLITVTTGFDDGIPTPSPIVHPVLFNSRAICTPSEGLKPRPSWLGSPALAHSVYFNHPALKKGKMTSL
jgi:hypothetical protein